MSAPVLTGHDRASLLRFGRHVAAELVGGALDASADLATTDRHFLATLASAVDLEVSRRAGVAPAVDARKGLAEAPAGIKGLDSAEARRDVLTGFSGGRP